MSSANPRPAASVRSPHQVRARCADRPLVIDDVRPDLAPLVAATILQRSARSATTPSLNVGAWKSAEDFLAWPDPAVAQLRDVLAGVLDGNRPIGWAMVNRLGSHHPRHVHRGSVVSGIYYVDAGDVRVTSPTVFEVDRGEIWIEPHPGRLVLFPGDLWHRVPAYPGTSPRITVAFDVRG